MANGKYLIDANAFIDMGERFYPEDVFSCVWNMFSAELNGSQAVTIDAVLAELSRKSPLDAWRSAVIVVCKKHAVNEADPAIQAVYARLAPQAQPGGGMPSGLSDIDLFVLATGEVLNAPIVTRDREIRLSCERGFVNTRAIEPAEYFREMTWSFK